MSSLTQYNYAKHRKTCVDKAVSEGYLDSPSDARYYDLTEDGQFHLKVVQFVWFPVHISIYDFEL